MNPEFKRVHLKRAEIEAMKNKKMTMLFTLSSVIIGYKFSKFIQNESTCTEFISI